MNTFKHTDDFERMPSTIVAWLKEKIEDEGPFSDLIGGDIKIVTNNADLLFLPFRVVKKLDNVEDVGNFTLFFEATNNAGGDAYFVPTRMLSSHQLLAEIKRVTIRNL